MKILGLHGGHDSAYAILEDGVPTTHNELERFNRQKGCKGDSLQLFELTSSVCNDVIKVSVFFYI